uniref:SDR family NAD(P)-dependent oxidoreductase n=1 Tax=Thaumasiovibrio occultus TaxID=1891184 RepID=UPI000B35B32A|nr:SDR family oxidoreductase [Thaumasiovibrio occultus]
MYKNAVVIITGGSQGLGLNMVQRYVALQASVVILDIVPPPENLASTVDFIHTDLGDATQIEVAFDHIEQRYSKAHVLINNGAIANLCKPIQALMPDEFARLTAVNLTGAYTCVREFVRLNEGQTYGRIVNIASTRHQQNEPHWDAYGASKGGLVSLTQSLCISLASTPITVNAISPGWIQTADYDALSEIDHQQHPSGRVGIPRDISNAVLFLTDRENDFINGANLVIDGGMTRKMIYLDN